MREEEKKIELGREKEWTVMIITQFESTLIDRIKVDVANELEELVD